MEILIKVRYGATKSQDLELWPTPPNKSSIAVTFLKAKEMGKGQQCFKTVKVIKVNIIRIKDGEKDGKYFQTE